MTNEKKRLEGLLQKIQIAIENQTISSEDDLVQLFRVRTQGQLELIKMFGAPDTEENATVLEIMGYDSSTVEDHPVKKTLVGTVNYAPDYILKVGQTPLAIVDLKAPDVKLDNEKWLEQLRSYCHQLNAPLGILFNGREMRVLINTDTKAFQAKSCKRYKELFDKRFVAAAELHDLKQLVDLLSRLSFSFLEHDAVAIAKKLAKEAATLIGASERQKHIKNKTQQLLAEPPEELLKLMSGLDVWQGIDPVPSDIEIATAWNNEGIPLQRTSEKPASIASATKVNPLVRQKVAELCERKGFDFLQSAQIKGLRMRFVNDRGYHLVLQKPGVPAQLRVGGMNSADAVKVIQQLDELLKS